MKISKILLPSAVLVSSASAGIGTAVVGSAGCLGVCGAAFATCHAAGHSLSIFTFTVSSWLAGAGCHHIFIACEAECMKNVAVASVIIPA